MDRSLLPEEKVLCPGWQGSATILPARLRVLEANRSGRDGRLQPITFYSRTDDTLQSAFVIGSGSSVPDGDGGGEDGLDDAGVEVHHHCLWQVELLQLPQEVHP